MKRASQIYFRTKEKKAPHCEAATGLFGFSTTDRDTALLRRREKGRNDNVLCVSDFHVSFSVSSFDRGLLEASKLLLQLK